jgi:peptidyl-prolyl cis-trans isomerase D
MGAGPSRSGNGQGGGGNYGTIYGQTISANDFAQAQRAFFIYYWQQSGGEWPDRSASFTPAMIFQRTYSYLLINAKAKALGINISDAAVVAEGSQILRSPGVMRLFNTSQPVPPADFLSQVLTPEGLTMADFQRSIRTTLTVGQMVDVMGLPGALVTPQEVGAVYDHEYQEVSAQAVFFPATNYLSQVKVTPAAVSQFYTDQMASYREPDRVQVNYVAFTASNSLAQAQTELKTNLEQNVEAAFQKYGSSAEFAAEKTPAAIKAKIRNIMLDHRALEIAANQAKDFVSALYAMSPVKAENLATLAKQKKLTLVTSAPFSQNLGPTDFDAPTSLTKAAFQLNADAPYTGPLVGSDAAYVIALAQQLPSTIPPFNQIQAQVTRDFEMQQAIGLARTAGTNFYFNATIQVAAGKTFSQAAVASGHTPAVLEPFSLSSAEVTGLDDRAEIGQIKQAAFGTPPGRVSRFSATSDGGFVLYVNSLLPVDEAKKTADFPQFLAQARRARSAEAFNLWVNTEFSREIASQAYFQNAMKQYSTK